MWPFVLQFSSFPFALVSFLCPFWWVPSLNEVVGGDLEAYLFFLQCSSFGEVDFVDLETRFCFPFWVSSFRWSRFCWLWGTILFLTVLFLSWSRFCWPWGTSLLVSLVGCPHFGEADFVDLEVLIYFLQCASFGGVDLFDPEARIFAVRFLQWSRSLWPWGTSLFFAVDHSLTSRLWAYWVFCLQMIH